MPEHVENFTCPPEAARLAAEGRLAECPMRRVLTSLFEESPQPAAFVDLDGRFLRVNAALCHIVEYSDSDLLTRHVADLLHPEHVRTEWEEFGKLQKGEKKHYRAFRKYITASGYSVGVLQTVYPLFLDDKERATCFVFHFSPVHNGSVERFRQLVADGLVKAGEQTASATKYGTWKSVLGVWLIENWQTVFTIIGVLVAAYLWMQNLQNDVGDIQNTMEEILKHLPTP